MLFWKLPRLICKNDEALRIAWINVSGYYITKETAFYETKPNIKRSTQPWLDHGWVLRFLQNIVTRFDLTSLHILIWLFLIIFDLFGFKSIWQRFQVDNSRHILKFKSKQTSKKMKESEKVTETKKKYVDFTGFLLFLFLTL